MLVLEKILSITFQALCQDTVEKHQVPPQTVCHRRAVLICRSFADWLLCCWPQLRLSTPTLFNSNKQSQVELVPLSVNAENI